MKPTGLHRFEVMSNHPRGNSIPAEAWEALANRLAREAMQEENDSIADALDERVLDSRLMARGKRESDKRIANRLANSLAPFTTKPL